MVFQSFKRLAINYFIKPKSCRKGSGRSHFFQEIISTQFAGNNPTEPSGATPLHHPSSICSIFVIISSGSNEISVSSPGVMKKKDTMRNQPGGDTAALVTNLDFHSTKNRHCDWLILGHVPLIKLTCIPTGIQLCTCCPCAKYNSMFWPCDCSRESLNIQLST